MSTSHPTAFYLIYNDPRRFGYLEFAKDEPSLAEHPLFRSLGVEPLSEHFNIPYLLKKGRHSERYVKTFIMDQKVVVGIGNIYASEILFQAKIKPKKKAGRITADQWKNLIQSTQHILHDSIEAGGSTIRDYRNAEGESGDYQSHHHVYDREGLNCDVCGTPIKHEVIGGRSTYWCPQCQK